MPSIGGMEPEPWGDAATSSSLSPAQIATATLALSRSVVSRRRRGSGVCAGARPALKWPWLQFAAEDVNIGRGLDPQAHPVLAHAQHRDHDLLPDADSLVFLP
jgi:hypothetical protein